MSKFRRSQNTSKLLHKVLVEDIMLMLHTFYMVRFLQKAPKLLFDNMVINLRNLKEDFISNKL